MAEASTDSGPFAALSASRGWRYTVFTMLYVAQGIPIGLLLLALPAYMADQGVSAGAIGGYAGLATLPHALKLFLGPVMDRWTFLPMGRRRPWVLFAQCGIIVCLALLALLSDPLSNMSLLTAGAVAVNFFVAFQDVATDGMAVDILHHDEQSRAASFMFGGQGLGVSITTAGGAFLLDGAGLGVASLVCAGMMVLIALLPLLSRERPGERLLPWTVGDASDVPQGTRPSGWVDIITSLFHHFFMRSSIIFVIALLTYALGRGLHRALLPVYYIQELGWSDTGFSGLTSVAGLIAALITMTLGGLIIQRVGRIHFYALACTSIAALGLAMALLPMFSTSQELLVGYRVLYGVLDMLTAACFISIAMAICTPKVAATQFATYMALSNLGLSGGQALLGPMRASFTDAQLFVVFSGITFVALFIMRQVEIDSDQPTLEGMDLVAD